MQVLLHLDQAVVHPTAMQLPQQGSSSSSSRQLDTHLLHLAVVWVLLRLVLAVVLQGRGRVVGALLQAPVVALLLLAVRGRAVGALAALVRSVAGLLQLVVLSVVDLLLLLAPPAEVLLLLLLLPALLVRLATEEAGKQQAMMEVL
jgi:hypothetical protein